MILEMVNELGDIRGVAVKDRLPVERVKPLVTGELAPFFSLVNTLDSWQASLFSTDFSDKSLYLPDLLEVGPVVVSFYCPCWGTYARPFLSALKELATKLQSISGQLVVFTNENPRLLARQVDVDNMLLAYDAGNAVARRFGVYSENDPIWDRVSGISEDVYVPAIYTINRFRQIQYHFLDENFEGFTQSEDLFYDLQR
ncbi:redoxin domain-containing protein [Spirosoma sp. BT702]|uniref:Redoxin domain-containing protein n=1 Tax=Spirosoma profusum TaxID=2771354 RepID=A0A927AW71_9BACT|nr:redoxin domain-containing protein [Spirosoma profusum]MBD2705542.1 redoxin domain-containing protein [Spirosoma profusum]